MKKILALITFIPLFLPAFTQQPVFITDSLDKYIEREMKRWNIPGVSIAIVKDGQVIVSKGYGVTDLETKQKVDENTLFMIASNTKIFTGTSIAMLDYQGRLSLEDKVIEYLPYFKMYNDTLTNLVTLEDILSHRLGFDTFQGDFYNWGNNATRKEIVMNIAKNKPVYQFRDTWGYCNAGFVTAGEVISAVTDTTWDDYINAHFFKPLEMNRSSTTHDGIAKDKNAAVPYSIFQNELIKLKYDNIDNIAACGSINSCSNDLSNWLLTLTGNGVFNGRQVIPEAVILETRLPRSIVGDGHSGLYPTTHFDLYGLGIEMNDYEGREMVWHTGGANGFVSSVCVVPDENLGIAVLTNTDANYFFLACLYQIIEAYFEMPYRNLSSKYFSFYLSNTQRENQEIDQMYEAAKKYEEDQSELKKFTGTYFNDVYGEMKIIYDGGRLRMIFEHHPDLSGNLDAQSENIFICTYDPISWGVEEIPFDVQNGKVISATVSVNDFIDYGTYLFVKQ